METGFIELSEVIGALGGGVFIGLAATVMMATIGRIVGISGIIGEALTCSWQENQWRYFFLLGLLGGGFLLQLISPAFLSQALPSHWLTVPIAGLLVGFGTAMGSGCTSGHGVCGISRLSKRSLVATICFMVSGFLAVYLFKKMGIYG